MTGESNNVEKFNYVDLFKATVNTLNEKKSLTKPLKDKALRFYFLMSQMQDKFDEPTQLEYNKYYEYLKNRRILI